MLADIPLRRHALGSGFAVEVATFSISRKYFSPAAKWPRANRGEVLAGRLRTYLCVCGVITRFFHPTDTQFVDFSIEAAQADIHGLGRCVFIKIMPA